MARVECSWVIHRWAKENKPDEAYRLLCRMRQKLVAPLERRLRGRFFQPFKAFGCVQGPFHDSNAGCVFMCIIYRQIICYIILYYVMLYYIYYIILYHIILYHILYHI